MAARTLTPDGHIGGRHGAPYLALDELLLLHGLDQVQADLLHRIHAQTHRSGSGLRLGSGFESLIRVLIDVEWLSNVSHSAELFTSWGRQLVLEPRHFRFPNPSLTPILPHLCDVLKADQQHLVHGLQVQVAHVEVVRQRALPVLLGLEVRFGGVGRILDLPHV